MDTEHTGFDQWFEDSADVLQVQWRAHLSEMQDSREHILFLANSDECFREWAEERYSELHECHCDPSPDANYTCEMHKAERTFAKPAQSVEAWKGGAK